jgi:hypothetical protein
MIRRAMAERQAAMIANQPVIAGSKLKIRPALVAGKPVFIGGVGRSLYSCATDNGGKHLGAI